MCYFIVYPSIDVEIRVLRFGVIQVYSIYFRWTDDASSISCPLDYFVLGCLHKVCQSHRVELQYILVMNCAQSKLGSSYIFHNAHRKGVE